jgi:hypothetical protein
VTTFVIVVCGIVLLCACSDGGSSRTATNATPTLAAPARRYDPAKDLLEQQSDCFVREARRGRPITRLPSRCDITVEDDAIQYRLDDQAACLVMAARQAVRDGTQLEQIWSNCPP